VNIGVLGGTFDPVHIGHIMVAEEVGIRINLAKLFFIPAGKPWLKENKPIADAKHRVQMVRLAISDEPRFNILTTEVERSGLTYSVDTITELQANLDPSDELFFILGWDSLAELPRWREPSRLIKLCKLVAVPRPDYPRPDHEVLEKLIQGLSERIEYIDKPMINISASDIRNRVADGLTISHLVPGPVDEYIREHKLYLNQ
jgi:nicotinate-nucleotide adenylyltransferase